MTETENWILNEFANDLVDAIKTQSQSIIDACQKEYDDYFHTLRQRIAERPTHENPNPKTTPAKPTWYDTRRHSPRTR